MVEEKDFVTRSFEKAASGLDAKDKKFVSKTEVVYHKQKQKKLLLKIRKNF